jgi:hypothetical protein
VEQPTYDDLIDRQVHDAITRQGQGDLPSLFAEGDTWTVEE